MFAPQHQSESLACRRWCVSLVLSLLVWGATSRGFAEDYIDGFEEETPSWQFLRRASRAKVLHQVRSEGEIRSGQRSESLLIETYVNDDRVELAHQLPPAVRFDELKASVWVWSDHPGIQASVRVRLPNQIDQRTKQMLVFDVYGDIHAGGGQWQRLQIDLSDRAYKETLRRVRSDLARRVGVNILNEEGAFVDQMSLRLATDQNTRWDIKIDDLELSPVIAPRTGTVGEEAASDERITPRVRIGDDRVLLDGRPFFPLFLPYHGESVDTLTRSNCNVVWVPDYQDSKLLQQLSDAALGVMATPPQPDFETMSPDVAGLVPFKSNTDPILMWMLDVQIPSSRLQQASAWAEMVRDADRQRSRPILADVMGKEREYHRQMSLLGASRSILHTSKTPRTYADTLELRKRMALPGKPMFTLITTEPAEELLAARPARSVPPIVEPEQIWMQANIALAAGYKGIGYLSFHPLDSTSPGAEERLLAIELMNYQIRLLEPWLATAKVLQQARVQIGQNSTPQRSPLLSRWDVRPGIRDNSPAGIAANQIQATVLECDQGLMVLVNWLEDNAQYQPGRMFARDVRILVNRDIVQACEMTTTGVQLHTLGLTRVAGGTEILLKEFNQSAVILITNDHQAKDALNAQITRVRPMVSEAWANLARAKLVRVRDVHHQLVKTSPPVTNAEPVLREASNLADQAQKAHETGSYSEVERLSRKSMSYLRDLQQAHWRIAVGQETSPASSPYTICFQTLPDHWHMKEALKHPIAESENLLKSGSFDDTDAVLVGWTRTSGLSEDTQISTTAALVGPPDHSNLHLSAVMPRGRTISGTLEQPPVLMASPEFSVSAGDIIRVQGRLEIRKPIESTTDGLLIYDSLVGTAGALRFKDPLPSGGWQDFEFYREVATSGEMRIFFELKGLGNVWLDDLRVTAIQPRGPEHAEVDESPPPRRLPTNESR